MYSNLNGFGRRLACAVTLGCGLLAGLSAAADGGEVSWVCRYHVAQSRWFIRCVDPERDDPALGDSRGAASRAPEVYIPLHGIPYPDDRSETLVRALLCPRDARCSVAMAVERSMQVQGVDIRRPHRIPVPPSPVMVRR